MIRINLLPSVKKKKKKRKPLPAFVLSIVVITGAAVVVLAYMYMHYNTGLQSAKAQFSANGQKMAELKKMIAEVDSFEKLNKTFDERNKIIEQLRKNQNIPVMMLDEISRRLPGGVWLYSAAVSGDSVSMDGYAFTNSDVVAYVDSLKSSTMFSDIYLQESKQGEVEKVPVYQFKLTFRIKA